MEYRQLGRTYMKVSSISLGGAPLGGVYNDVDEEEAKQVVKTAIDMGINFIDTAPFYGQGKSEILLGKALKGIDRRKYYIATKVGRYEKEGPVEAWFDFSRERTLKSVDISLERLGLEYIDLIQVHDVEFCQHPDVILSQTLPALVQLKTAGKIRHIGVTGYTLDALRYLAKRSTDIDTVLSYCRLSLCDTSLTRHFQFFQENHIGIINASPFAMGLLSPNPLPSWHPAPDLVQNACKQAFLLSEVQGVDMSKLAIQYAASFKEVSSTLFGTSRIAELQANIKNFLEPITESEKRVLEEILQKYMMPLKNMNWEGVKEDAYWKLMNTA